MTYAIPDFARKYARKRSVRYMNTDTCVITRPTPNGEVSYDPSSRLVSNITDRTIYTGQCRLWAIPGGPPTDFQGQYVNVSQLNLTLPWTSPETKVRDRVLITASVDPDLIGRALIVLSLNRGGALSPSRTMTVQFEDTFTEVI